RGITAIRSFEIAGIDDTRIISKTHSLVPYDLLITFPPAVAGMSFPLPTDDDGFILTVPETRQVRGFPNLYAVGDVADLPVKQAYLATTQADAAAEHIAAGILLEVARFSFEPTAVAIVDKLDGASYAEAPVRLPDEDANGEAPADESIISDSPLWRAGRLAVAATVLRSFRNGVPVHSGVHGAALGAGRDLLTRTLKD